MLPLLSLLALCRLGQASSSLPGPLSDLHLPNGTSIPSKGLLDAHKYFADKEKGGNGTGNSTLMRRDDSSDPISIDVFAYVVTGTEGNQSKVTDELLEKNFEMLNRVFAPAHITFSLKNTSRVVDPALVKPREQPKIERGMTMAQVVAAMWSGNYLGKFAREAHHQGGLETLNFYAVENLTNAAGATVEGFGMLPPGYDDGSLFGSASYGPDGVVMNADFFASDEPGWAWGAHTAHEVGHWLGLLHAFSEDGNCTGPGDFVDDTPAYLLDEENRSCDVARDSCPDQPGKDPVSNYMGYEYDLCASQDALQFTPGQMRRVREMWKEFRAPGSDAGLEAGPEADTGSSPGANPGSSPETTSGAKPEASPEANPQPGPGKQPDTRPPGRPCFTRFCNTAPN